MPELINPDGRERASHAHARHQLDKAKIESSEICVVLSDSIVYRTPVGVVMTAWTRRRLDGIEVLGTDPGMPMWPSAA